VLLAVIIDNNAWGFLCFVNSTEATSFTFHLLIESIQHISLVWGFYTNEWHVSAGY